MADIEKLDQDEKDNNPIIEINEEANVNYITSTRFVLERYISNSHYI